MLSSYLLTLTLALAPSLVSAAIFPSDSLVKVIDAKGFKKAMRENQTSVVAFFAPWCGHCQKMAPDYSRAALGLYPLIPSYAVDCDDEKNKRLCAEQGVKGFPTIKLFPRGKYLPPIDFEGERSASSFYYFAIRRVPPVVKKLHYVEDIQPWVEKEIDQHRIVLLTKEKNSQPLLWKVLGNKYHDRLLLASHRDRKGRSSEKLGYEVGEKKEPKVLVYPKGSTQAIRYKGINKFDSLSAFFDSILDGTADLTVVNEKASEEVFQLTEEEAEIQRKQEIDRIALAHGGFTNIIDFEKAMKNGGADYHDSHGYGGMMGGPAIPEEFKKKPETAKPETVVPPPITAAPTTTPAASATDDTRHAATGTVTQIPVKVAESETETAPEPEEAEIPEDASQVVFEAPKSAGHCGSHIDVEGECTRPKDEL